MGGMRLRLIMRITISEITMDDQDYYLIGTGYSSYLQRKSPVVASDNPLSLEEEIIVALCEDMRTEQTQAKAG